MYGCCRLGGHLTLCSVLQEKLRPHGTPTYRWLRNLRLLYEGTSSQGWETVFFLILASSSLNAPVFRTNLPLLTVRYCYVGAPTFMGDNWYHLGRLAERSPSVRQTQAAPSQTVTNQRLFEFSAAEFPFSNRRNYGNMSYQLLICYILNGWDTSGKYLPWNQHTHTL